MWEYLLCFTGYPSWPNSNFEEFLCTFKLLSCFDRFSDDYKRPREFPFFYSSYPFPLLKKAHCRDCPFYFEQPVKIAKVFLTCFNFLTNQIVPTLLCCMIWNPVVFSLYINLWTQANFHDHLNETSSVKIYSIEGRAGQSEVTRHQSDVHYNSAEVNWIWGNTDFC